MIIILKVNYLEKIYQKRFNYKKNKQKEKGQNLMNGICEEIILNL